MDKDEFQKLFREHENIYEGPRKANRKKAAAIAAAHKSVDGDEVELHINAASKSYVDRQVAQVRSDFNGVLENLDEQLGIKRIELKQHDKADIKLDGVFHKDFEKLVRVADVRNHKGMRKPILMKGGMGGGKSTALMQLAELLGFEYGYIPQINMPHQLLGHVDNIDKDYYHHTALTRLFSTASVIAFEEFDAWSPNASLAGNIPIGNGILHLENGQQLEKHPDCIIVACANTWGTGATAEYVGRNKMDNATLDRFIKLPWDYDEGLERKAAANDEVVDAVQMIRSNCERYAIKIPVSPRTSIDCADMVRAGFTLIEALEMTCLAQADREQRKTMLEDVDW